MRPPEELLYDSEASLRLVDHAIGELNGSADADDRRPLETFDVNAAIDHVENVRPDFQTLTDQQLAEITRLLTAMRSGPAAKRPA
jgi:hypothetical protein